MADRKDILSGVHRIVVKVGTAVLSSDDGRISAARIASLAGQIDALVRSDRQVVIVSSGAIGSGMAELHLEKRPTALPQLQAAASIGQARLIAVYNESFKKHGHHAAQILLTQEDFNDRTRYLNARNTMNALFEMGAIPVINENDAISVDEIRFGDNDRLSALVASLIEADLLVLLSTVDGLLDKSGRAVSLVEGITDQTRSLDRGTKSDRGTGGLRSKLEAADLVTRSGAAAIIANGTASNILTRLMQGEDIGTLFIPQPRKAGSRKRWFAARTTRGVITVDDGARRALLERGKSLLPSGIVSVSGDFKPGDTVAIHGPDGRPFAHGLTNLSSKDLAAVRGMKTAQVRRLLGTSDYDEAVHRDNLYIH